MSYGLFDGDLKYYARVPFFNLELMKLSSYYKKQRQIVSLSPTYAPNKYSNFIIRQDYYNQESYPFANNVSFGGRAFDGKTYKPLELSIESSKPDRYLYNRIRNELKLNSAWKNTISTMGRAEHIRLSLDEKTIWKNFERQLIKEKGNFGIIFHDYNLGNVEGALPLIKNLLNELYPSGTGARVGMKFPTEVNNEEDLIEWLKLKPLNIYYSLQYNGYPSREIFPILTEIRKNSSTINQSVVNVTRNIDYETFTTTGIVEIYHRILDLRKCGINFQLIYDKDFFIDQRWLKVLEIIKTYNYHINDALNRSDDYLQRVAPYETLYSYAKKESKNYRRNPLITREDCIEAFQFLRFKNYDLFKSFYEYTGE